MGIKDSKQKQNVCRHQESNPAQANEENSQRAP
jgi:hypothetical protein